MTNMNALAYLPKSLVSEGEDLLSCVITVGILLACEWKVAEVLLNLIQVEVIQTECDVLVSSGFFMEKNII